MGLKTRLLASGKTEDNEFNISLLGFKIAVNDGLTVFNLNDGIVDEFHDESGTDESEGSNDAYCTSSDFYVNSTNPTGVSSVFSAGFTTASITEPDTSTAGTNPALGDGVFGTFTVPSSITSVNIKAFGASGAIGDDSGNTMGGGSGGYAEGTLAVTGGQSFRVVVGEGGGGGVSGGFTDRALGGGGRVGSGTCGTSSHGAVGGGLSGIFPSDVPATSSNETVNATAPQAIVIAGGGGGGGYYTTPGNRSGGHGGGLTGCAGGVNSGSELAQTNANGAAGGGGDQEQGGQGAPPDASPGQLFRGGDTDPDQNTGGGGGGYYGGGGAVYPGSPEQRGGGGGSSYFGHPQITSGSTNSGDHHEGGGDTEPEYPQLPNPNSPQLGVGQGNVLSVVETGAISADGFMLITGGSAACTTSTTLVSTAFSASIVPTTSRIVVFEENIDTPTLNTDIIASISRDGGSNYTTATLTDSGYVTGSSGQRILTGQATISGQPSGQSMRWKLALANNTVKIHGVSLQWS